MGWDDIVWDCVVADKLCGIGRHAMRLDSNIPIQYRWTTSCCKITVRDPCTHLNMYVRVHLEASIVQYVTAQYSTGQCSTISDVQLSMLRCAHFQFTANMHESRTISSVLVLYRLWHENHQWTLLRNDSNIWLLNWVLFSIDRILFFLFIRFSFMHWERWTLDQVLSTKISNRQGREG